MRWFMHKTATLEMDLKADGSVTKLVGMVVDVDGTGVAIVVNSVTSYYPWTRVQRMYV